MSLARAAPPSAPRGPGRAAVALAECTDYIERHSLQALIADALDAAVLARADEPVAFIAAWLCAQREPPAATIEPRLHRVLAAPHALSAPGVFTVDPATALFTLAFDDEGVPYGQTASCTMTASRSVQLPTVDLPWRVSLDATPTVRDGINLAGRWVVEGGPHGTPREVLLPGVLTYDPAGRSGDPHASERVGAACARQAQLCALALLSAALHGAGTEALDALLDATMPLIEALHGRVSLNLWLHHQCVAAVVEDTPALSYAEFVRRRVARGEESLDGSERAHARTFFESEQRQLPPAFWREVGRLASNEQAVTRGFVR